MLTLERDDSALLPGMFRLEITAPDEPEPTMQVISGSFTLVGRAEGCTCRLGHPQVARRHAYLQAIHGRLYCVDLGSEVGTYFGDKQQAGGWLDPDTVIRVGPYQVRLVDTLGLGSGSESLPGDFNPLDRFANEENLLPQVAIHVRGSGRRAHYTISRPITLVGSAAPCKLRLGDPSVSSIHCSLLWLPDGLWAIDLAGKGGTSVQGKVVRCAKIAEGEKLRIGKFTLRVHYPNAPEAHRRRPKLRSRSNGNEASDVGGQSLEAQRAALIAERAQLDAQREALALQQVALAEREQMLEGRESKFAEAQMRLAAEWEQYHAERAALVKYGEELARHHEAYTAEQRRQAEQAESLERQRIEMAARADEVADTRKNLKAEWQKLEKAKAKVDEVKQRLAAERTEMANLKDDLDRRKFEIVTSEHTPMMELETIAAVSATSEEGYDALESTRHNKVFATERVGDTLVVIPLGDAHDFHYGDVHTESNKVRRLLEGGKFKNLVVDLGSAPIFTAVTINVAVVLSRIISNRGGRAVLCEATEKTRGVLENMKLAEMWRHFPTRAEAIGSLET
jgi:pSer/pThr/pTyr-binding forkhead associated (FHA) protein